MPQQHGEPTDSQGNQSQQQDQQQQQVDPKLDAEVRIIDNDRNPRNTKDGK